MRLAKQRLLLGATFAAALAVNVLPLINPLLLGDDFEILARSWTWERTQTKLWEPQNEHAMPLGRLSTRGLILLAGRASWLPLVTAIQGPMAQLTAMALLYLFVRRELGDQRLAVIATAIFGVTSIYHQAIYWFAASFSVLALDTLMLALLAAQAWRKTGRWRWIGACVVGTALAPAWFASGILAGPLCSLYLLSCIPLDRGWQNSKSETRNPRCGHSGHSGPSMQGLSTSDFGFRISDLAALLQSAIPLVGTAAFLAVSLPRTLEYIMHLEHYESRTAAESFNLCIGAGFTGRSLIDNLCLGQFGVSAVRCPVWLVPICLLLVAAVGFWWWRTASTRRLIILGLGFIFSSYLLVYSARAKWDYDVDGFSDAGWSRYHLLPQLGLALIVVGGMRTGVPLAGRKLLLFCLMLPALFALHFPRVSVQHENRDTSQQQEVLRLIEEMDARCRRWAIDADTAKSALDRRLIPLGSDKESAWEFLRGSDDPRPVSVEEARRLLEISSE